MLGAGDSAMNGRDKIGAFTKLPCLAGETVSMETNTLRYQL